MATAAGTRTVFAQDDDPARWQARAISLAEQKHTTGTARYIGLTSVGGRIYKIRSRTSGNVHVVIFFPAIGKYTCDCTAGIWGKACSHAGAALYAERAREIAERETRPSQSQDYRWWKNTHD